MVQVRSNTNQLENEMVVRSVSRYSLLPAACVAASLILATGSAQAAQATQATQAHVNHTLPGKVRALAEAPAPGRSFRDCSNRCPEMVVVPQGRFTMGAPAGEEGNLPPPYSGHAVPQHVVTIRHRFAIAKFDVTRDEYAQFVAETHRPDPDSCTTVNASGTGFIATNGNWHSPGFAQTGRDPVVCVGWDDVQAYVSWLSAKTGHAYRLPTEAEWEYAARAGTTTARYFSDNPAEFCRHTNVGDASSILAIALACRDGYAFTSPVGSFPPNQFGLYDMLGDVMNWTEDCWNINYSGVPTDGTAWLTGDCSRHVVHGGSWDMDIRAVRSAMRRGLLTSNRNTTLAFRVARTL
jgi:formylglycine-generating enzyme